MYKFTVLPAHVLFANNQGRLAPPSFVFFHTVKPGAAGRVTTPSPTPISPSSPLARSLNPAPCLPACLSYSPTTWHTRFGPRRELNVRFSRSPAGRLSNPSPDMSVCKCVVTRVLRNDDGQAYRPFLVAQLCCAVSVLP